MTSYWKHLASNDIARLDKSRSLVLLPIGAVEQHGPQRGPCQNAHNETLKA